MAISKKISLDQAKKNAKDLNVIIYGSIRNVEQHLANSFSNIEKIANCFNDVMCMIIENDSFDKTRQILVDWTKKESKIEKRIVLGDNLDIPSRTKRLAYCRNRILDDIFERGLDNYYQYAFHCDMDEVFWGVDVDKILTCFQYDHEEWDMMGCVNDDCYYYDYWALRHDGSYFSNNIFSKCHYPKVDFREHRKDFMNLIGEVQKSDKLIPVRSCFNGFGVYRLKSLRGCWYSGVDNCKDSCSHAPLEDNDHVGLHKSMLDKNAKLFINTEMVIKIKPGFEGPSNTIQWLIQLPENERRVYSQSNEDGILDFIFKKIRPSSNPMCVEFGYRSPERANTTYLKRFLGWRMIGFDIHNNNPSENIFRYKMTSDNICKIFREHSIPKEPEYVSVDVDSCDLWILNSLLSEYKPMVFSCEYNCFFDIDRSITIVNDHDFYWKNSDNVYGASLKAINTVACKYGYTLVHVCWYNDAFFIRNDLIKNQIKKEFDSFRDKCGITNFLKPATEGRERFFMDYDEFLLTGSVERAKEKAFDLHEKLRGANHDFYMGTKEYYEETTGEWMCKKR